MIMPGRSWVAGIDIASYSLLRKLRSIEPANGGNPRIHRHGDQTPYFTRGCGSLGSAESTCLEEPCVVNPGWNGAAVQGSNASTTDQVVRSMFTNRGRSASDAAPSGLAHAASIAALS